MSPTEQPWVAYPRSTTSRPVWSTEDELLFVTLLGTWCEPPRARAPLLQRYLDQIPSDLVVRYQVVDIVEVIFSLIWRGTIV
jgi:hypothetical protein